jgi:hypothetical protein
VSCQVRPEGPSGKVARCKESMNSARLSLTFLSDCLIRGVADCMVRAEKEEAGERASSSKDRLYDHADYR